MALLGVDKVTIAFGGDPVLDEVTFQIERGERLALLGRNGCGKSTLMKIIAGELSPDSGNIAKSSGTTISTLPQDIPAKFDGSVFDVAARAFVNSHLDDWEIAPLIEKAISQVSLDSSLPYNSLSAGNKRRAILAGAIASEPEILLLDEPTNHLDVESVIWMEEFFVKYSGTLIFVTHDRRFMQNIATKIAEIDLGKLTIWDCSYEKFLIHKQDLLDAEKKEIARFEKRLSQEEVWIRKGIQARRTRNEGRVRALKKMRQEKAVRRERQGSATIKVAEANRSGKIVMNIKNISYAYEDNCVIKNFSTKIMRNDKIGIIGKNGSGKSTLLNLLTKTLTPDTGDIIHGTNLEVIYFDQLRETLDPEKSVWENVLPSGGDMIEIDGVKKHIIGYLEEFLFSPERIKSPVKQLSGGECNRLLLARLFTKPANLLILDEPTNDLDMETLELLEELIFNFSGTIILVTHDRTFLDNAVTSTIVFEENGRLKEFVGGYSDWVEQKSKKEKQLKKSKSTDATKQKNSNSHKNNRVKKLGFNEKRELEKLPKDIELMEEKLEKLFAKLADPEFYKNTNSAADIQKECKELEETLAKSYERWEELEAIK